MQFLKPFQEETSRLAKTFLNNNPELMNKYVGTSMNAISYVLVPLNAFMKHLILVQNLDPNSDPEQKKRDQFYLDMRSLFDKVHEKEYEDEYDLSWALKRFEETRTRLKELQLTKEKFMDITNLTRVDCGVEMAPVAELQADHPGDVEMNGVSIAQADGDEFSRLVEDSNKDTPIFHSKDVLEEQREKKSEQEKEDREARREDVLRRLREKLFKDGVTKSFEDVAKSFTGSGPVAELKKALEEVIKAAKEVEKTGEKKGVKTSKKKLNKAPKVISQKEKKEVIKTKIERATELANDMVARGLCRADAASVKEQIDEILKFTDDSFEALNRVVSRHSVVKNPFKE